jgi:hypothetical protein
MNFYETNDNEANIALIKKNNIYVSSSFIVFLIKA